MPARKTPTSGKAKAGKAKTTKAKTAKAKIVPGKCSGWKAILNMMPPGPSILRVHISETRIQGHTERGRASGNQSGDFAAEENSEAAHRYRAPDSASCERDLHQENQVQVPEGHDPARWGHDQRADRHVALVAVFWEKPGCLAAQSARSMPNRCARLWRAVSQIPRQARRRRAYQVTGRGLRQSRCCGRPAP
jgi:hypothetical protein